MEELQRRRMKMGKTQKNLSEESGVSQQAISAIERGDNNNPGIHTARKLAKALECTVDDLFPEKQEENNHD